MSLQKRLNFSFMAMIIIPCILFFLAIFLLFFSFSGEEGLMSSANQLKNTEKKNELFSELKLMTTSDPEKFHDETFLSETAAALEDLNIALVLRIGNEITFTSMPLHQNEIEQFLTPFGRFINQVHESISIGEYVFKLEQHDFYLPNQDEVSIFLVKEANPLEQFTKEFLPYLLLLLIIILVATNGTLSYFVSKNIVKPIKALQKGTENIKSGNLDFEITINRNDEIGDLTKDFESMRQKLKDSLEIQKQYEENRKILISNISHDLKTPITSIKGYVEGIRDGVANTAEKQQKYVNTIYKKAVEMDALIDELFLFSTLDLNRVPFQFEKVNIVHFINESIDDLSYDLEKHNIQIQFQHSLGSTVLVEADLEKLMRVFNNIIQNSVKYLDKDEGVIQISLKNTDPFLLVSIQDNGCGIPSEDLPHIFQSFYRADKSRNSKTGGTGLGLAICKQIIEAHGGSIWAVSNENKGSTMLFTLKLAKNKGDNE